MGSAALKPSHELGRLLREKRKEFDFTLREVSEQLESRGESLPASTLARIEQGKLDPGVRRLHLLLGFYGISPQLVAELVELEARAAEPPPDDDPEVMYQRGVEFWKKGDIPNALASMFAMRAARFEDQRARTLRQKALLTFATFTRNLGKHRLAKQIVEDVLCEPPDPTLMWRALILSSSLWTLLGSKEVALALVRQARTHGKPGHHEAYSQILHQEAWLLLDIGEAEEAAESIEHALRHYRHRKDSYGESRALILRAKVYAALEEREEALATVSAAVAIAEQHDYKVSLVYALLVGGRVQRELGNHDAAIATLSRALATALLIDDHDGQFHAHYLLWKTYADSGETDRAAVELAAARYHARLVSDDSSEADEIRSHLS